MGKMGEAFIEIGLLDKIDTKKILRNLQPIEDVLRNSTDRRRVEIEKAFRHQMRLESEAAAKTKARIAAEIVAEEALKEEEAARLRIMLGENEALDAQIRKAMQLTAIEKQQNQMMSGIRAVPLAGTPAAFGRGGAGGSGARGANQAAMNMAQLSYAIQDFSTGLAMGNFTQAVMGASNNLGMMAQSIGPVAGGLTVIAASLLPHAVEAIDKWEGHAERAVAQTMALKKAFDEFQDSLQRASGMRRFAFDLGNMEEAGAGTSQLKDLAQQRADMEALNAEREKALQQSKKERKGVGIEQNLGFKFLDFLAGTGGPQQGVNRVMTQEAILEKIAQEKKLQADIAKGNKDILEIEEKRRKTEERLAELQSKYAMGLQSTFRAEMGSPITAEREKIANELNDRLKDIKKNAGPHADELSDLARKSARRKRADADEEDRAKKRANEDALLDIMNPSGARRRAIEREFEERRKNIDKEYMGDDKERLNQQSLNRAARQQAIDDDARDQELRKRRLKSSLAGGLDKESGERMAIEADLAGRIEEINKMGLPDAERQQLLQQAHAGALKSLGEIGPRASFAGIADLSKQIQQSISDNPYQQQIATATAQVQQNTKDTKANLDKILQDGIKMSGVGLQ